MILDGLLGLGAKPPLRDPVRTACRHINQLREKKNAYVFAVDLPTGLDGDSGKTDRDCVVADFTVTIGFAKPGLVADGALNFVGGLEVVHLDELRPPEKSERSCRRSPALRELLPRRKFSTYKNQCGRIGVVAGSKGFIGAALMTSQGALRAGAGSGRSFCSRRNLRDRRRRRANGSDGEAAPVLSRLAQGKDRRLGAGTRSWKIARCRNSRADRKSKATDGD